MARGIGGYFRGIVARSTNDWLLYLSKNTRHIWTYHLVRNLFWTRLATDLWSIQFNSALFCAGAGMLFFKVSAWLSHRRQRRAAYDAWSAPTPWWCTSPFPALQQLAIPKPGFVLGSTPFWEYRCLDWAGFCLVRLRFRLLERGFQTHQDCCSLHFICLCRLRCFCIYTLERFNLETPVTTDFDSTRPLVLTSCRGF